MDFLYDPHDPAVQADPYPCYARLREQAPVYTRPFDTPRGEVTIAILSRHDDCVALLRDPRCSARKDIDLVPAGLDSEAALHPLVEVYQGMMLFRDPPDHTRLRTLVNKAFTPRRVDRLRARIEALVETLVAHAESDGGFDLIGDLAAPLPVIVIAELLGVPGEDHAQLKTWSDHAAMLLDGTLRDAHLATALPSFLELVQYMKQIVEQRRREPRDDLISALVQAQDRDDRLDDAEVLGTCVLILGAGHETTTNLIGNGMLALLRDGQAWRRLVEDPSLVGTAVEELLRFDSPVQVTSRIALEPLEIRGVKIPAGREVNTLIGSANRDPAVFERPDALVLDRRDNRHLSFGHGAHFCLGAPLARLEGQVTLATLARRFPGMELQTQECPRRPGFVLRGRSGIPVRLG